jgi:hypothetical protein
VSLGISFSLRHPDFRPRSHLGSQASRGRSSASRAAELRLTALAQRDLSAGIGGGAINPGIVHAAAHAEIVSGEGSSPNPSVARQRRKLVWYGRPMGKSDLAVRAALRDNKCDSTLKGFLVDPVRCAIEVQNGRVAQSLEILSRPRI